MLDFVFVFAVLLEICRCRILPEETSRFTTSKLPTNARLMATISNGYVGMQIASDTMYIGGVFNGASVLNESQYHQISHRARIPSTNSFQYTFNGNPQITNSYTLDVNDAMFYETYISSNFNMNVSIYANRHYPNLLVTQIDVDNSKNSNNLIVKYKNNAGSASSDINFKIVTCPTSTFNNISCVSGSTKIPEYNTSDLVEVVLVHYNLNGNISVNAQSIKTFYFPTVLLTTLESTSSTILNDAVYLFASLYSERNEWLKQHINDWESIWMDGRVDVIGNDTVAASVYSSYYYIISSIRNGWPYGLSPGSLSSDAYSGHTFWDQESWMYPPLLVIQQQLSAGCLEYRNNRIFGAEITANISKRNGLSGSGRFPWESAFSGIELQGTQWGTYEIHINADIPLAMKQYFYMSRNMTWLNIYYDMLYDICLFWQDWSYYNNKTKSYEFLQVMGPDEYNYPVDNNAYTNFGAQQTLSFGIEASKLLNKQYPSVWDDIVSSTYIPYDTTNKYHPESDNYKKGTKVKQADTIMLYFPWQFNKNSNANDTQEIQTNDLNYYASVTDTGGPAMTWAMFVINWLELSQSKTAQSYFDRSYANIQKPFNIWTETSSGGGAVNFVTGAGGFLQQFLFGYPGIRINDDNLSLNFKYLPWNQMGLIGIDYIDNVLDIMLTQSDLSMDVTVRQRNNNKQLQLIDKSGNKQSLAVNQTIKVTSNMYPIKIQLSQ